MFWRCLAEPVAGGLFDQLERLRCFLLLFVPFYLAGLLQYYTPSCLSFVVISFLPLIDWLTWRSLFVRRCKRGRHGQYSEPGDSADVFGDVYYTTPDVINGQRPSPSMLNRCGRILLVPHYGSFSLFTRPLLSLNILFKRGFFISLSISLSLCIILLIFNYRSLRNISLFLNILKTLSLSPFLSLSYTSSISSCESNNQVGGMQWNICGHDCDFARCWLETNTSSLCKERWQ